MDVETDDSGQLPEPAHTVSYVTEFLDFASADGWYRKYRIIFIDGRPYPYHLAIARQWLVHYHMAGMERDTARRDEERRFLADPCRLIGPHVVAALGLIGVRLGLDYAGIDFGGLPDGGILVFGDQCHNAGPSRAGRLLFLSHSRDPVGLRRHAGVTRLRRNRQHVRGSIVRQAA